MAPSELQWSDRFSTDVASVDQQHRELLALMRDLLVILSDETTPLKDRQAAFQTLVDHAIDHFDYEERIMRNIGYPDLEKHQREHNDLRAEIAQITKSVMSGDGVEDWKGLVSLVQVWLLRHILSSDTRIAEFIHHDNASE